LRHTFALQNENAPAAQDIRSKARDLFASAWTRLEVETFVGPKAAKIVHNQYPAWYLLKALSLGQKELEALVTLCTQTEKEEGKEGEIEEVDMGEVTDEEEEEEAGMMVQTLHRRL